MGGIAAADLRVIEEIRAEADAAEIAKAETRSKIRAEAVAAEIRRAEIAKAEIRAIPSTTMKGTVAVSYTHLTLPTRNCV